MTIARTTEIIAKIKQKVGYKGRTIREKPFGNYPVSVNSYWSGGSRDYWYLINLATGASKEFPQNGTPFDRLNLSVDSLADNEILVLRPVYGGKTPSITVYL